MRDAARPHGLGIGEAVPVPRPHDLAPHHELEPAHLHVHGVLSRVARRIGVHVDQLDDEIGVFPGRGHVEAGEEISRHRDVLLEHIRLEHQHVRARGREPLVLDEIPVVPVDDDLGGVGHGFCGIADVLGVFVHARRPVEGQSAAGLQVEVRLARFPGRPAVEGAPLVRTRDEYAGLGQIGIGAVLQVVIEEGQLDGFPVVLRRGLVEVDVLVPQAAAPRPSAVPPRTHDEVVHDVRVVLFHGGVGLQRTVQVLGVEEPADHEHRGLDVSQVGQRRAGLPEFVVVGMLHHGVPDPVLPVQVLLVDVRERTEIEVPAVAVRRAVIAEPRGPPGGRHGTRRAVEGQEAEAGLQLERAVVVAVVADPPVGHGRLGRHDLHGGMGADQGVGGVETGRRDAPYAHAAVVIGHVLQQPVDRIVGIRALVDVGFRRLVRVVGTHGLELPFGHHAAAHVLVHDDVPLAGEEHGGPDPRLVRRPVRRHAVGRALQQDGIGPRVVLRHVDGSEQPGAVAHGHVTLHLLIVLDDVPRVGVALAEDGPGQKDEEDQTDEEDGAWHGFHGEAPAGITHATRSGCLEYGGFSGEDQGRPLSVSRS